MPKMSGEMYRNIRLCVDFYEQGVWRGRWYHPGLPGGGRKFSSLTQFLAGAEALWDGMNFPQSFTARRSFLPLPSAGGGEDSGAEPGTGARGTFIIRCLFRQNTSWQGSVRWMEGQGEQTFRSVLELILLIDSALGGCGEGSE